MASRRKSNSCETSFLTHCWATQCAWSNRWDIHSNKGSKAEEYIIGDKAYPVLQWCIPSYRNFENLTEAILLLFYVLLQFYYFLRIITQIQTNFNLVHAQTRQVIERTFSLLKRRFRRLKFLDMNQDDMIPYVIIASCVLHNICLNDIVDNVEDFIHEGQEAREVLLEAQLAVDKSMINEDAGIAKRDYLAQLVS